MIVLCCAAMLLTDPPAAAHEPAEPAAAAAAVPTDVAKPAPAAASFAAVWELRPVRRLCCAIMLMGIGIWVPAVHLIQFARDRGFDEKESESLLLLLAVGSCFLRVPLTIAADRLGRKRVFTAVLISLAAADVAVVILGDHYAALMVYALLIGGLIGALLSMMPTLPADEVPKHMLVQGTTLVCSCLGLGTSTGPMLAGSMFDWFGTYTWSWLFAAATLLCAAVALNVPCACFVQPEREEEDEDQKQEQAP